VIGQLPSSDEATVVGEVALPAPGGRFCATAANAHSGTINRNAIVLIIA
jgi:hypothetical protein